MRLSEKQAHLLVDIVKGTLGMDGEVGGHALGVRSQLVDAIVGQQSEQLTELDTTSTTAKAADQSINYLLHDLAILVHAYDHDTKPPSEVLERARHTVAKQNWVQVLPPSPPKGFS